MNVKQSFGTGWSFAKRHQNVLIFLGGFLFDFLTIERIDSLLDLGYQVAFLIILTVLIVLQYRHFTGQWEPSGPVARFWHYNVEILHFVYGGLLSNYVVLYFMSSTGARPVVFFLLLAVLMVVNEMPQIKKYGYRLRLGLYSFCLCSFLIYFVPILLGFMGWSTFLLAVGLAGYGTWALSKKLIRPGEAEPLPTRRRLFLPAGCVLAVIVLLYALRLIPPVPLSVKFQGIYHGVRADNGHFVLTWRKPPWYRCWRKESRPFLAQPGDQIFYFVRVYAPARFRHRVMIRWQIFDERRKIYTTSDLIPLTVKGGRAQGFRGMAVKTNFSPGRWRVEAETDDGRTIGMLTFDVKPEPQGAPRTWVEQRT